jgi:hypothetical protein
MLSFRISYWNLTKFPYFVDTTERGDKGWKRQRRQSDFRDNSILLCFLICRLHVILIALDFLPLFLSWLLFQLTCYIKYSNWYDGVKYFCLFHNILCTWLASPSLEWRDFNALLLVRGSKLGIIYYWFT